MGNFSNLTLTESGRILLSHAQAGAVLIPTKIIMGAGFMPAGKTPEAMTEAVAPIKELTINKRKRSADGKATFGGVYSNADITEDFYFRELALFCKAEYRDESGNVTKEIEEAAYSYGNSGKSADLMTAYSSNTAVEKQIDIVVWVGNNAAVELTVESGVFMTQAQALELIEEKTLISDAGTGTKYRLGIENGLVFLEEV